MIQILICSLSVFLYSRTSKTMVIGILQGFAMPMPCKFAKKLTLPLSYSDKNIKNNFKHLAVNQKPRYFNFFYLMSLSPTKFAKLLALIHIHGHSDQSCRTYKTIFFTKIPRSLKRHIKYLHH